MYIVNYYVYILIPYLDILKLNRSFLNKLNLRIHYIVLKLFTRNSIIVNYLLIILTLAQNYLKTMEERDRYTPIPEGVLKGSSPSFTYSKPSRNFYSKERFSRKIKIKISVNNQKLMIS